MSDELAIDAALYSKLTGGTALVAALASGTPIWNSEVPEGSSYPVVVFGLSSGMDDNACPWRNKNMMYFAKAISTTSLAQSGSIDALVDALLNGGTISPTGWACYWMRRASTIRYVEYDPASGTRYYHTGGIYRVRVVEST